jgi:predicted RNA-binding Zn ribbon-like protein
VEARPRLNKRTRGLGRTRRFPRLLGGKLCLDFANTIDGRLSDRPEEFLHGYDDFVGWGFHRGYLSEQGVGTLISTASSRRDQAEGVFERAIGLRLAVYRVFRAIARSEAPSGEDLDAIRSEYCLSLSFARLVAQHGRFEWTWDELPWDLSRPLWPVARSAVELLTGGDVGRVKECLGPGDCGWLFYDASRNASRRWCSMEGCGSRVKMRRYNARRAVNRRRPT